jgi:hypothetical protein
MLETSDLIKAYLKTAQQRYRVLVDEYDGLEIFRGHTPIATLGFQDTTCYCKLLHGSRTVDLHEPDSIPKIMAILECFEWIVSKIFDGTFDPMDVAGLLRNDDSWNTILGDFKTELQV